MRETINVLVICDQDRGNNSLLNSLSNQADFHIIGIEKDLSSAIIISANFKPEILIIDLQSPEIDLTELAPIIRRRSPSTSIIIICEKEEDDYACRALKAGISGILIRETDMDKIVPIVHIVFSGGYYITTSITNRVFGAFAFLKQFPGQAEKISKSWLDFKINFSVFSPSERKIVTSIAQGLSDPEIANNLNFSTGTVRNYINAIKRKTKLKNRTQIVIYSLVYGLINFDKVCEPIVEQLNRALGRDRSPIEGIGALGNLTQVFE